MTWDFGTVRKTLPQAPAPAQPPPRTGPSAPIPLANNVRSHDYAARPQTNGAAPAFVQPAFQTVRREPEPAPIPPASVAQHVATPSDDSADDDQSILDSVVLPALDGVRVCDVRHTLTGCSSLGGFARRTCSPLWPSCAKPSSRPSGSPPASPSC